MKHPRFVAAAIAALFFFVAASASIAQTFLPDTARIAFENADRTAIYVKKLGSSTTDTILKPIGIYGAPGSYRPSHVAILASSADGNSLLVGLRLAFYDGRQSRMDSIECFARLDSPFTLKGTFLTTGPPLSFGTKTSAVLTVLKAYHTNTHTAQKPLPLGVLTADGKDWYGTWRRTSVGDSVEFFHGKFDASGDVDSVTLRGDDAPIAGFKMTNLITTVDGTKMIVGLSENVQQLNSIKTIILRWTPNSGGGQATLQSSNVSGIVSGFSGDKFWNTDSIFAYCLRNDPNSADKAQIGFFARKTRNINFYSFPVSNGITHLDQVSDFTIPGTAVLDHSQQILGGFSGNSQSIEDSSESIIGIDGSPTGAGGDIMFSSTGDSVVFVTCSALDQSISPALSSIYLYDWKANKSYLVQNATNEIERQPIFLGSVKKLAPPPPYVRGVGSISKAALDLGQVFLDSTTAKSSLSVTAIRSGKIIIHSAVISGDGATAFALVSPPTFPATLLGGASQNFTVSFLPSEEKTYDAVLTIMYRDSIDDDSGPDSVLKATLHGVGVKRPEIGYVRPEAQQNFSMTVMPNPFSSGTEITVDAKISGSVQMEVVDISGRSVFQSEARILSVGEHTTFTVDAKSLKLGPGSYYIVLHTPIGDVMRKAIVIE